jgi:RimJ/RimL family protein N-acetyltransferase
MRIELRGTTESDLPILFENQADPVASAMAAFGSRDRAAFLEHQAKIQADPSVVTRTIVADGAVAGSIASFMLGDERAVGYWIGRAFWGKGIATSALRAFLDVDGARPLYAHVAEHNVGSRRVVEKAGFVFDHEHQDEDVLEHVFVLRT